MSTIRILGAAALLACAVAANAAPPATATVGLDGSASTHKKATLAGVANRQLQANDVPSVKTEPVDAKAQADADIARRGAAPKGRRLKVERQNLKGDAAAHVIAQQHNPSTYDRDISMGDKDHTEQVTNLKVTIKK
jgi:hypothetical protein